MTWAFLGALIAAALEGVAVVYYRSIARVASQEVAVQGALAHDRGARIGVLEAEIAERDAAAHAKDETDAQTAAAGGVPGAIGFLRDSLRPPET